MADSFTSDQVQGVFGRFTGVIDETVTFSDDIVQGIFGEFKPVFDEAAGVVSQINTAARRFSMMNFVSSVGAHVTPLFFVSGGIAAEDRIHLLNLYGGLFSSTDPSATNKNQFWRRSGGVPGLFGRHSTVIGRSW